MIRHRNDTLHYAITAPSCGVRAHLLEPTGLIARYRMEGILKGTEDLVADSGSEESYLTQILNEYEADMTANGAVPIALQIDAATEQLNQLKFQFIEVSTKQIFLEKIAASSALDTDALPCPSMQELARLELAAEQEKANLKKVKIARATASEQLGLACREVSKAYQDCEDARGSLAKKVRDARAGMRLRDVTNTLKNGTPEDVAKLASTVDEQDAKACELILTHVFSELTENEQVKSAAEAEVETLQSDVERHALEQSELNSLLGKYKSQVDELERANPEAPALREESMRHQKIYETVSALTRARISSIYDGGICIQVTVDRRVEVLQNGGVVKDAEPVSILYNLDMGLRDVDGMFVTSLQATPTDIDADSLVSKESPVTVPQAVQAFVALAVSTPLEELQNDNVIPAESPARSESSSATL